MNDVDQLVTQVRSYHPNADLDLIRRAYHYSEWAHREQTRKSGDPYFVHPASVAEVIADLRLDTASVCAGLLHDVVEDTLATFDDLQRDFGVEIATLVDGVTKLGKINFTSREDRQAENFRKMVIAMAQDIRVLLIKLCDRLDNMRTLDHMVPEAQERIARETMDIYAPLANRLGIHRIKSELEDLSFRYLNGEAYRGIVGKLAKTKKERDRYIEGVCRTVTSRLAEQGFAADVNGRAKHVYAIYRKMKEQQCEFEQVFDVIGFRICVESVADCYATLGVVHSKWTPIPGRFKDYVALPKPNMYQSLHTAVIGPGRQRIEIQIRTHEMHRVAEHGVAAHWKYKERISGGIDPQDMEKFGWLRELAEQAFAYETWTYNPVEQNWPDLRYYPSRRVLRVMPAPYQFAWCHGAGGIALSRLRAYELTANDHLADVANTAGQTLLRGNDAHLDLVESSLSLCHGLAGSAEILAILTHRLGICSLEPQVHRITCMIADRLLRREREICKWGLEPGLMLGTAGIAWYLFRASGTETATPLLPA